MAKKVIEESTQKNNISSEKALNSVSENKEKSEDKKSENKAEEKKSESQSKDLDQKQFNWFSLWWLYLIILAVLYFFRKSIPILKLIP